MSGVKEIESALEKLSVPEMESVRDWLDDLIEEQLEINPDFKSKVTRAKQELREGIYSRRQEF